MTIFTKWLGVLSLCITLGSIPTSSFAQFWSESFETDGNGTRYTTSVPEVSDGSNDFFTRTNGSNISGGYDVSGADGDFFFAAQDIDAETPSATQTLSFSNIDISGRSDIVFSILIGEDDDGSSQDWDTDDHLRITYSIDGGPSQNLIWIQVDESEADGTNGFPSVDTDFNGRGDGTEITDVFQTIMGSIAGTGSSLDIELEFAFNSGDEDIAVDLLQLSENGSGPPPPTCPTDAEVFINEFHYDNSSSGDPGEFVEVAIANSANVNPSDITLTLYNGSNGQSYNTLTLGAGNNDGTFTYFFFDLAPNGLQNGSPDGFALSCADGTLIQFLSYEGTFTASNGPAAGATSEDVGVSETNNTPPGSSIQLIDGTWTATIAFNTKGATNAAPPANCEFTNVSISQESCDGDDFEFRVDFTALNTSGQFEVVNTANGQVLGNFLGGSADGSFFVNATLAGPTTAGMLSVAVRDVQDNTCSSSPVMVTLLDCPIVNCANPGDLVISEIMQNPSAVGDSNGEYFEVYNTTGSAINLIGYEISDFGDDSHTISSSVIVPAFGYAVLGINANTSTNGGVTVDYEYNGFTLANGDDEVILSCDGAVIDQVNYDGGPSFPDPNGASMSLNPDFLDAVSNDTGDNWCASTSSFGDGDLGTPGGDNDICCATPTFTCLDGNVVMLQGGTYTLQPEDVVMIDNMGNSPLCPQISVDNIMPATVNCDDLGETIVTVSLNTPFGNLTCSPVINVAEDGTLPFPWAEHNVGTGVNDLDYSFCENEFSVSSGASNSPITTPNNNFGFISQTICGNGSITVKVEDVSANAFAGIAIRESSAPNAKQVVLMTNNINYTYWLRRAIDGAPSQAQIFVRPRQAWLRITRTGNIFRGFVSFDGNYFAPVSAASLPMAPCVEAGMLAFGTNPAFPAAATFSNVTVTGGGLLGGAGMSADEAGTAQAQNERTGSRMAATELQTETRSFTGGVELYPNPATDVLNLNFGQVLEQEATLRLINAAGQMIEQQVILPGTAQTELYVAQLQSGIYLIELTTADGGTEVVRFMKQ